MNFQQDKIICEKHNKDILRKKQSHVEQFFLAAQQKIMYE